MIDTNFIFSFTSSLFLEYKIIQKIVFLLIFFENQFYLQSIFFKIHPNTY